MGHLGVAPDDRELGFGQLARLVQDRVRDPQLADIVEERRPANLDGQACPQAESQGEGLGHLGGAPRVRTGEWALGVDDVGKCAGDPVDIGAVRAADLAGRLQLPRPAGDVGRSQLGQERGCGRQEGLDHLGVVPRPAPGLQHVDRHARTPDRVEDIEGRARGQDPGEEMNLAGPTSERQAMAVPVFMQVTDRRTDVVAEAGLPGDRRAPLTAGLLHQSALTRAGQGDPDEPGQPGRQRLGQGQAPDRERGICGQRAVQRRPGWP